MNHLPRNGQYEIFTHRNITHCFDDINFPKDGIPTPAGMFDWIKSQDPQYWYTTKKYENVAFYLQPELYTAWKLKYL